MLRLGMHTDNWRHLDRPFEDAVEAAAHLGLECIEFGVFDGQYFIQALGYNPHLPLTTDPVPLRRYLDSKGLRVSQIDAAYPLTSPEAGPYGVPYVRKAILFAEAIGCPYVDTTDGGSKPSGYSDAEVLTLLKHNLRLILETAENTTSPLTSRRMALTRQTSTPCRAYWDTSILNTYASTSIPAIPSFLATTRCSS